MNAEGQSNAKNRDSTKNIVVVALVLSIVCSILVSGTAVLLKPRQLANQKNDRQRIILEVAGLLQNDVTGEAYSDKTQDLQQIFSQVESRVVELASGNYIDTIDAETFDAQQAGRDPAMSVSISAIEDIANIGQRAKYATVYLVREDGQIKTIVLPVYGYGLWSTMYGFVALENDANTVAGLRFYQQAETPGLGAEIDNPKWRALWKGKLIFNKQGEPQIEVIKGIVTQDSSTATSNSAAQHQIDGLAGSTLTGRGVSNLMHYWMGESGFGPYLNRLRESGEIT